MANVRDMVGNIEVEGILKEIGATPAQVCDGLLFVLGHTLAFDPIKLEAFIERNHRGKYDCEASVYDNCEAAFGKRIADRIRTSILGD